jgi:uncharacterized OB-fold protein
MQVPRYWRTQKSRYALVGTRCSACDRKEFPPRSLCTECGAESAEDFRFCGRGEVFSFSTIRQGPNGFSGQVPYVVALVRLQEGPLLASQLTSVDPDDVELGMPVEMVTRRLSEDGPDGIVIYGYKFRPAVVPDTGLSVERIDDLRAALLSSRPPTGILSE